jgi:signal transduction histidine kinase
MNASPDAFGRGFYFATSDQMILIYFVNGLAFFSLGLAVALEARRTSEIPLSRHLLWLAGFGLIQSLDNWIDLSLVVSPSTPLHDLLTSSQMLLSPLAGLLLVRFGIGLVSEAGALPAWLDLTFVVLIVPASLLVSYAVILAFTVESKELAIEVWSRYLLYVPGGILAAFGFVRQWRGLSRQGMGQARRLLLGAAMAFAFNAFIDGFAAPRSPYGLALWLNDALLESLTGIPPQAWAVASAVVVTFLVIRALDVFEVERKGRLESLERERTVAQSAVLTAQRAQSEMAENWTNGLVSLSRQIANMEDVDRILRAVVEMARKLLASDTATLALWDANGARLELKCYATAEGTQVVAPKIVESSFIVQAVRTRHSCRYPEDIQDIGGKWICPVLKREVRAAAIAPLLLEDQLVGGIWVGRYSGPSFTAASLLGLEHLADQAVIAFEHAVMTSRLQTLAMTEERARISREMHDGLLQVLGYLSVQMQTLEAFARKGNSDKLLSELCKARESIKSAQADVRENVLSLRTTLSGDLGLISSLQDFCEEFGIQTGIDTHFESAIDRPPRLSPLAEAQLVRIVQESLANVRKHSHARSVRVGLDATDRSVRVTVSDDGIGFDSRPSKEHFGLQTMRERAESVNGALEVVSEIHAGTRVELTLPLVEDKS